MNFTYLIFVHYLSCSFLSKTPWALSATSLRTSTSARSQASKSSFDDDDDDDTLGSPILITKRNLPMGFADTPFATSVMDRFPEKNYKGLPLPEEELPMFCYPTGCRLERAVFRDAPLPSSYGFVVKNERGDSLYGKFVQSFTITRSDLMKITGLKN